MEKTAKKEAAHTYSTTCPSCKLPVSDPTWLICPRCRADLSTCGGCSACGKCGKTAKSA